MTNKLGFFKVQQKLHFNRVMSAEKITKMESDEHTISLQSYLLTLQIFRHSTYLLSLFYHLETIGSMVVT
jgi:hypothetical protein